MVTDQEYEKVYLLARKIVRFEKSLANKQDFCNHLETVGYEFDDDYVYEKALRLMIFDDILNCYFLLGYPQTYNSNIFLLLDLVEYAFYFGEIPWSYKEFQTRIESQYNCFFSNGFEVTKNALKSVQFPLLYIELSNVDELMAEKYINFLQSIAIMLSENQYKKTKGKDELIDVLLSNPKLFLNNDDENDEGQQFENIVVVDKINDEHCNMEHINNKVFNGISFDIIREEYREGYSDPFLIVLRVTNYNDHKKNIEAEMKYISMKYGLKSGYHIGVYSGFIPDKTFVDFVFVFEDITCACNGDRIELEINKGKFASLKLTRESGQWTVSESVDRSTFNRDIKNKIEHFEALEEKFGIILQNFSVKVEDENTMKLFCEVLALNGEIPKGDFTINVAIYDNNNDIVYTDSESRNDEDFKGFEVITFDYIKLDITVDEISKIRIYPTR